MIKTNVTCVGENILIRLPEVEEKTEGGIIKTDEMIAAEASKNDEQVVEVASVGEKVTVVKKGDKILIKNPRVAVYNIDGVRYGGILEYDIFAVVTTETVKEPEVSA